MRKFLSIVPWSKYIAGFLIFTLLFLQTIRVEFFSSATAKEEDYRDIVSIFVDTDTYASLRPKILRYAEDIQSYLGEARATLYVVDAGVTPAQIASRNEKLYYEGDDGDAVSNLVGTVLIGNLPIPMVSDGGEVFPSLYPYVDFTDKAFVYNERSLRYELPPESTPKVLEADIWHGVINPAVGREWQGNTDRQKISNFLDKTHLFYTKSGRFAPTGQPPRVFYYDGEYESESVNFRSLFQYTLGIQNAENLAYNRFTKHLLSDLNKTLLAFDASENTEQNDYLAELGITGNGGDGFDEDTIKDMQDIHTKIPIQSIIKDFQSIINKNTLSEALANIYNAGRYNSGTSIRADIAPLQMTVMDELARNTLKEANSAVMKKIDQSIQSSGFARSIAISESIVAVGSGITYDAYFFGKKASTITDVAQCSIARGSNTVDAQYGKDVLVEANAAYDINLTEGHAGKLKTDTEELVNLHKSNKYLCFDANEGTPKIDSYWGKNTLLRVVGSDAPEDIMKAPPDNSMAIKGYSEPVFSLGGMIESNRLAPPSIADCMGTKYQYSLKRPYTYQYTVNIGLESNTEYTCEAGYPGEWNRASGYCYDSIESRTPRYTCVTAHDIKDIPAFESEYSTFSSRACFVGSMTLNGTVVATANNTCIETIGSGEDSYTIDRTIREDYNYRLLPGFLKHVSPTDEEISAAESNGVTPSLPVDMVRYLEFLTPKGNIARINYPNFFEAPITDRASIRAWLKNVGDTQWNAVITREGTSSVSVLPTSVEAMFSTAALPATPLDWNSYISDESIDMILRARNWLNPDVTKKYKQAIETSLSYSREYPGKTPAEQTPKYPLRAEGYDIAYLGLFPFEPASEENMDDQISNIQNDYDLGLSSIHALNVSEPYQSQDQNPYGNSDKCGPPEGVNIFQWPAAIMCWIQTLLPPRIIAGSCSSNTIGLSNNSGPLITPSPSIYETIEKQKAFYEGGKLYYRVDRTSLRYNDSIEAKFEYVKNDQRLNLPYRSTLSMEVLSLVDDAGREIGKDLAGNYITISPQKIEVTDAGGKTLISSRERKAVANVRAVLNIVLSDGSIIQATSDPIRIRITTEYLQVFPKNKGSITPTIDVTDSTNSVSFALSMISESGIAQPPIYPVKYTLIDEVSSNTMSSGTIMSSGASIDMTPLNTVGVYRFILEDAAGRVGETSLTVESGKLAKVVAEPLSSMIRAGANTMMMIRLEDVLSNPVSPDLEKITIRVTGGYISDSLGEKKTEMTIDTLDNSFSLLIGSDTAGALNYQISTESGKQAAGKIDVIQNVKVVLAPETIPKVGGVPVKMVLKIQDTTGKELAGFDSVASLVLPRELGTVEEDAIAIKAGISKPMTFLPGTKAGIHKISLDIPGLGVLQDITFELLPGTPLYVSHEIRDTNIDFSVRDRYGNVVRNTFTGTLKYNTERTQTASFTNGVYTTLKKGGFYTVHVPSLANEKISYTDGDGNHDIPGIPYYATYIQGEREKFDFLPDYNARYTVLYGESFLREGEDILFDSSSTDSQSLAVSTLLDTPYEKNEIVSIFPGGKIEQVNAQDDMLLETSVTIIDGYPAVNVFDSISMKNIARILYPVSSPILRVCPVECTSNTPKNRSSIEIAPNANAGFEAKNVNGVIILSSGQTPFFRVEANGKVSSLYNIELAYAANDKNGALFDIITGGSIIGQMRITLDQTQSIERRSGFAAIPANLNTPIIDIGSSISHSPFSEQVLTSSIVGYRFSLPEKTRTVNESMIGPTGIDTLGETYENPGVGWQGANTSILSYAAGDTVGEATKWFHTYTMVNLGDPVAHVDNMTPGTHLEGIDRSIGTRLTSSLGSSLRSYSLRDMDKDGQDDIITLDSEGGVHLLLNRGTRIRYKEQIAYLPDVTERGLSIADTTGDGYGDILSVDKNGTLIFIDNAERKFIRKKVIITNGTEPLSISQFKIYDMDNDAKDDVVYLTESGELGVLYGTVTAGTFAKNILETTLGITLSTIPEKAGGAIKFEGLPQIPNDQFGVNVSTGAELDDSILQSEVYSQYSRITGYPDTEDINIQNDLSYLETQFNQTLSSAETSIANSAIETYIKSQYAPGFDFDIERSWKNISHTYLTSGDTIEAKIVIKNNGTTTRKNITYLDTIPSIFDSEDTKTYDIVLGNEKITRSFNRISTGEYDAYFEGRDLAPGQFITITYQLKALPMKHGNMIVSRLEKGESGDDLFGDVGFEASETCGDDMLIWRSGPSSRQYTKGTRSFAGLDIPESIKKQIKEVNNLSTATSLTDAERAKLNDQYKTLSNSSTYSSRPLIQGAVNTSNNTIELGFDSSAVDNIEGMMQDFMDGLSCGFGGGSCMSFPINWAPLAPGSAPTIMGFPVFPLIPETGLPLFSGITGIPIYGPWGCFPVPSIWPISPIGFSNTCTANLPSPGGGGGNWDPTNAVRIYVTPTLTLGMGAALCFAGPASVAGRIPPTPLFGLIKGGNCIVVAKPMPFCKGDGSRYDGDVTGFSGLGSTRETWNSNSCNVSIASKNEMRAEDREIQKSVINYLKNPDTSKRTALYQQINNRTARTTTLGPAIKIGGGANSGGTEIGIEIDTSKPFSIGNIVKVKNGRVPAFPEFIMKWVTAQVEEIVNALFTAPSLVVIWPGVVGANMQFDGNWANFQKRFSDAYSAQSFENLKTQMGQAYSSSNVTASLQKSIGGSGKSSLANDFRKWSSQALDGGAGQTVNKVGGGIASVRAAYTFIGQLPFLNIRRETVNIDVPWILPGELDKYMKAYENYLKEYDRMMANWCVGKTAQECADAKIMFNSSGFASSLKQNLKILNDYKNFPQKLQKYVTWKQRYMTELLCNVETVRQVLGGWIKDNGIRFKKWAELFVLLKALAESWQPLVDIFTDTSRKCGVCTNQRYDSLHWKFKLLSALIPSPPIIRFPRWPDIVLDLSDIRLGINVSVPDFRFNVKPLRLPSLPNLTLPNSPNLALSLPSLPILPALPNLPDLPSLPSLPKLALPNLPPPPKIPKLLGSIQAVLKIFKLLSTVYCFLNNTYLVPEGEVGDVIAKRTERQGKFSLDFLGIQFPNFTLPGIREIRVSTHVNFELRSDFITEFAKQAVKPINEFTTDLGRGIPKKIAPDINLSNPTNTINLTPRSQTEEMNEVLASLENISKYFEDEKDTLVDIDVFKTFLIGELEAAGLYDAKDKLVASLKKSERTSDTFIQKLTAKHDAKYDALEAYIQAEYDATGEMQNIIDALSGKDTAPLGFEGSDIRSFVSSDDDKAGKLLAAYDALNVPEVMLPEENEMNISERKPNLSILARLDRLATSSLAAATTGTSTSSSSSDIPDGYLPAYKGVYVLTPSGVQTRLYDADITMAPEFDITTIDIDKDGDKDYIFVLDGALYIKYTGASKRSLYPDTEIEIATLRENALHPTTPDYFHETTNAPKSLSLNFTPADEREDEWRLEFYDRYLEWDKVDLGTHNATLVPHHVVDMAANDKSSLSETSLFIFTPVNHILVSIASPTGFQMSGVKVTVLKTGDTFHLPVGKSIVTGDNDVQILILEGSGAGNTVNLIKAGSYLFKDVIKARVTSGKLFAFGSFSEEGNYTYSDDYVGMPIISSLQFIAPDGGMRVRYNPNNSILTLNKGSQYSFLPLGTKESSYYVNMSYPDGVYSARMKSLDTEEVLTSISLFAPQIASDKSAPVIDFPETVRIPVYSTKSFALKDFISEMHDYTVRIDPNTTVDEDKNGIYDDDLTTTGSNIIVDVNTLTFRAHTNLDTYTALMEVRDEMGNVSRKAFNVEIYAPIPSIDTITNTGWASGNVGESLINEPIHLFRVRPGTDIVPVTLNAVNTNLEGVFSSGTFFGASGAIFQNSGSTIRLNEYGVIDTSAVNAKVSVTPAGTKNPMKFIIKDERGVSLYEQFMILPTDTNIAIESTSNTTGGLLISPQGTYQFVQASYNDPNIPLGWYLVNSANQAIALLARDGNIYVTDSKYSLRYSTKDGYILLSLQEGTNTLANFWYKVDFFYTIK